VMMYCSAKHSVNGNREGFGGCIIASVSRDNLRDELCINKRFEIVQVIALATKETVVMTYRNRW
jgi:hypothetical protein